MAKKSTKSHQEALRLAEEALASSTTWEEMWNRVCGIGGTISKLFPARADREEFMRSEEWSKIRELMETLPGGDAAPSANGMLTLRIPKSLHAGLVQEAEAEGVSLNQLCMAKLAMQLKAMV